MENSRRKFLKIASHALGGTLAAGVVAPLVGLAVHPLMKETVYGTEDFIAIGKVDDFPVGVPKRRPSHLQRWMRGIFLMGWLWGLYG